MKTKISRFPALSLAAAAMLALFNTQFSTAFAQAPAPDQTAKVIPWDQIGAKAGADYHGEGLAVAATETGARLHCVFQRLEGEATPEGLWLVSTVTNPPSDRFRVVAAAIGNQTLAPSGEVTVQGQTVRYSRAGLVEEYSVSMDGVRQDFVVTEKPAGDGQLKVRLAVSAAHVDATTYGAQLVLEKSGRKIAYSRLRATDANGKELPARIEVPSGKPGTELVVLVNDVGAEYPVRIDPTFSDANWISLNGSATGTASANGSVDAAVADYSGDVYIGGAFTQVGNITANHIAVWNGVTWSALGSGISGGLNCYVSALAVSGSTLYAGGVFTTAGGVATTNVAIWYGGTWSALPGMNGEVCALAVSGDWLYAGGVFTTAGGNPVPYIARLNSTLWVSLGLGMNGPVYALAVSGSTLYAGGSFTNAGGTAANNIAQWNGSSWSALGSGISGGLNCYVSALAVSGSTLYAGGVFTMAGGSPANGIAQWNGASWSALGSGLSGGYNGGTVYVYALAVSGSTLYAGGWFTMAGGSPANYVAQWNGSSWSALGSGLGGVTDVVNMPPVYALAASGTSLYVGGMFTTAGGMAATNFAQWNGTSWGIPSVGPNEVVDALAVSGSTLYAGWLPLGIAQWNGSSWSALGSGMAGGSPYGPGVWALAVLGTNLYAAGNFTSAGGIPANYIAQWNGSSWSALGSGMTGTNAYFQPDIFVSALAVSGTNLYAGGCFSTAGGVSANNIAQWNGSTWAPLGSGLNEPVMALAVSGTNLYAGGYFTSAGGSPANYVAQWHGSSWSALGSGVGAVSYVSPVLALAASGSTLYAGGNFTTAGGSPANYVAQWNGSSWSALGSGVGWSSNPGYKPSVAALAVSGGILYAGGDFTTAGGNAANYIAQWNGASWSALGSGMNNEVLALAVPGSTLYAGGDFTMAGTNASDYAAEAILPPSPPLIISQPTNVTVFENGTAALGVVAVGTPPLAYQWQFYGTNLVGMTNSSLVLTGVQVNETGPYQVIITNAYGSAVGGPAVLTVLWPPAITSQSANVMCFVNETISLSVSATGMSPLAYQWQFSGTNLSDNARISGSQSNLLTIVSAEVSDGGNYDVIVTNVYGSATSSPIDLTVVVPVSITSQSTTVSAPYGGTAVLSVTASGTGPLSYQWALNGTNLPNDIIQTVAGNGLQGYWGDGGQATNAMLYWPAAMCFDSSGNFFIADEGNNRIRKVSDNGVITTLAGNGTSGYSGDGAPATNANLSAPDGVAVDSIGNVFVADSANNVIRKVATDGTITTVAGNGTAGYTGDGGLATQATLNYPETVIVDGAGDLLIADSANNVVRKVGTNGIITTVAGKAGLTSGGDGGPATNAGLSYPYGLALDSSGDLLIGDLANNVVRQVSTNGIITTVAGTDYAAGYSGDGEPALGAMLNNPAGVAYDLYGNLFIADNMNNVIRQVDTSGIITTVAGNRAGGYSGDGGWATNASLGGPYGVACDTVGDLLIADYSNNRVREVILFASHPVLPLSNLTAAKAGTYTVTVSSPYGSITSSNIVLTVTFPAPVFSGFNQGNGTFSFTWTTVSNLNYQVQYSTNLALSSWLNLGSPLTATGCRMSASDVIGPTEQRLYRVVLQP